MRTVTSGLEHDELTVEEVRVTVLPDRKRRNHIFAALQHERWRGDALQIPTIVGQKGDTSKLPGNLRIGCTKTVGEFAGKFRAIRISHDDGGHCRCPAKVIRVEKRQEFVEKISRVQQLANRLDPVRGQMNWQILLPLLQPKTLHEHEKSADVIGMEMRNENPVDGVVVQSRGFVTATDRFSAVNQKRRLPKTVKKRGVIAVGAGPAVADAESG